MNRIKTELDFLYKARDGLPLIEKQTVSREFKTARIDMEIAVLESKLRRCLAERVIIFLDAWRQTGRFTAIRDDGATMEANPVVTGDPVNDFWNVRGEAHKLANWSFWINSPWVL